MDQDVNFLTFGRFFSLIGLPVYLVCVAFRSLFSLSPCFFWKEVLQKGSARFYDGESRAAWYEVSRSLFWGSGKLVSRFDEGWWGSWAELVLCLGWMRCEFKLNVSRVFAKHDVSFYGMRWEPHRSMLRSQMKHAAMADAPRCVERKESPDLVSHNLAPLRKDCFSNSCGAKYWKGSQKGRSSTACSVGVVLHWRQE